MHTLIIVVLLVVFSQSPVFATVFDDPCTHHFGHRWSKSADAEVWGHTQSINRHAKVPTDMIEICRGYEKPSPYGSFIGAFSAQVQWRGKRKLLIAIDERFRSEYSSHIPALIAHELAHHYRGVSGKRCGDYLEQGLAGKFVICESAVDLRAAEWTSVHESIVLLKSLLIFKDKYFPELSRGKSGIYRRIRILEEKL